MLGRRDFFDTRICATVRGFAKKRRRGSLRDIYEFAEELDAWEPLGEQVPVRLRRREPGSEAEAARELGLQLGQREVGARRDQPPEVRFMRRQQRPAIAAKARRAAWGKANLFPARP